MIEYKSLDKIKNRISTQSPSNFGVGHSTKNIKVNFEDACGALHHIKKESGEDVYLACCFYCDENDMQSKEKLSGILSVVLSEWLQIDGKKDRNWDIVGLAIRIVYLNKFTTTASRANYLKMSKQSYNKTWRKYAEDLAGVILGMLSEGNCIAADYHLLEKQ